MIQRYLKSINSTATSDGVQINKSYLRALVGLDRRTLEDIGVSPQEVVMFSPSAVAWNSGVIASGLSARWSLSGDWDRFRDKRM